MKLRNRQKNRFSLTAFFLIAFISFAAGVFFYRSRIYQKVPGINLVKKAIRKVSKPEMPYFYPAPEQDQSPIFCKSNIKYPFTFIVYGDSREIATRQKELLIDRIISERPEFVIHLGDMVYQAEEHQWNLFDIFEGKITRSVIPIYPVLGNHEYHLAGDDSLADPGAKLRLYFKRFKFLGNRRWYSFRYGNSRFLFLDSNSDYSPGSFQHAWLTKQLREDSSRFLFVSFHHPPYTRHQDYSRRNSERFLADIFEQHVRKDMARPDIVFSAHVHNYERYRHQDVNYVVSGGGGAPLHTVARKPGDLYKNAGGSFHYCKITVGQTRVKFEMITFDDLSGRWQALDTFVIP